MPTVLETLLAASVEIATLKRENRDLKIALALLSEREAERAEFDLSSDELPALLRPQA
jgi:hypothetical protein